MLNPAGEFLSLTPSPGRLQLWVSCRAADLELIETMTCLRRLQQGRCMPRDHLGRKTVLLVHKNNFATLSSLPSSL